MSTSNEQILSPEKTLKILSAKLGQDVFSEEFAQMMDANDPLANYRQRFAYPKKAYLTNVDKSLITDLEEDCVYLCGNSLGLKPRRADVYMQAQLDKWARMAVEMHFEEPLPAAFCDRYGRDMMGRLVGADPNSVTLMNGLTVNLHLLLLSFYQPTQERFKILIEKQAFPSDRYAMRSQIKLRGFDPEVALLEIGPRECESTLRTEDIIRVLKEQGPSIAVVCLSGVQFYTGQKFDMGTITREAQRRGCFVGWDLAHAVGNVELEMDGWGVDFACWCTYKYLNSGPGCIAGAYVNKRHVGRQVPHLKGWWSNKESTRFEMKDFCDSAEGVDSFRLCNPPPFLVALVMASLEIFDEVGMDELLKKQFLLTGYLELLIKTYFQRSLKEAPTATIITPEEPSQRGCQLSLRFSFPLQKVHHELVKRGVLCDVRPPDIIRVAPVPLYNSFLDVYKFVDILQDVFALCKSEAA